MLPIKRLNVTDKVMDQTDKSLNKRLWGRYPFEIINHWDIARQLTIVSERLDREIISTPEDLGRAMALRDLEERYQLYLTVYHAAELIEQLLLIDGRFMAFNRFDFQRTEITVDPADVANAPVWELQNLAYHYDKYRYEGKENGGRQWVADAYQGLHPHPTGAHVPIPHLDKTLERLRSKSKNVMGWAHEHCLTEAHEGCTGPESMSSR